MRRPNVDIAGVGKGEVKRPLLSFAREEEVEGR